MKLGEALSRLIDEEEMDSAMIASAVKALDFFRWVLAQRLGLLTEDVLDGDGGKRLFALSARRWLEIARAAGSFDLSEAPPPEIREEWSRYCRGADRLKLLAGFEDFSKVITIAENECGSCEHFDVCNGECDADDDEEDWE